jgi:SAM-dependent methyltransferase
MPARVVGLGHWQPMAARFTPIHDHLVAKLDPRPGERWLDIGTGTGAVALRAARAGARVTAVDIAPRMIETARWLASSERLSIRFEIGDAETLALEDESFDVVASALGVVLAPDHSAAARELARVCRPGGRLGIVAWRIDPELERLHALPARSSICAAPGRSRLRRKGARHPVIGTRHRSLSPLGSAGGRPARRRLMVPATPMRLPSGSVNCPTTRVPGMPSGAITRVPPGCSAFWSAASTSGTLT